MPILKCEMQNVYGLFVQRAQILKHGNHRAFVPDFAPEFLQRLAPELAFVLHRAENDHLLQGVRMFGDADDLVDFALVVTVAASGDDGLFHQD